MPETAPFLFLLPFMTWAPVPILHPACRRRKIPLPERTRMSCKRLKCNCRAFLPLLGTAVPIKGKIAQKPNFVVKKAVIII